MKIQLIKIVIGIMLILPLGCDKNSNSELQRNISFSNTSELKLIDLEKFQIFHESLSQQVNENFSYNDKERKNFQRFPGVRNGVQINKLVTEQRIQLHDLLNDILSPKGYLKILHIISNEDLSSRTDEELGQEKYWLTFFGVPIAEQLWGFRFEGHHISLNFSFKGNLLISHSPTVYGASPSTMQDGKFTPFEEKDLYREGFNILFEEEDRALDLIASFNSTQYNKSYINLSTGIDIIGEDNQIHDLKWLYQVAIKDKGVLFSELSINQQEQLLNLINCYFSNFSKSSYSITNLRKKKTNFITVGNINKNQEFYYRIVNEDFLIEFQNIGNHIHCIFRNFRNDFGIEK